jgi:hypothetical protein
MKRVRGGILAWSSHWHDERSGHDTFSMLDSFNQYKPTAYALWLWASIGEVEYVWREEDDNVIKFMARTTSGEKTLIANKKNFAQDIKNSIAFHADSPDTTAIHKTIDSSVLPAYSIAVL